jgi:hypothetical protein
MFYQLSRDILHDQKQLVTGTEYERYNKQAQEFLDRMKKLIKK